MKIKHMFSIAVAISSMVAIAQMPDPKSALSYNRAVECAALSVAVESLLPKESPKDTEIMRETRRIVGEIHETSYGEAIKLGGERGLSPSEVSKQIVPIMLGNMAGDPNSVWSEMRRKCEAPYLSSATKTMMQRRNSGAK